MIESRCLTIVEATFADSGDFEVRFLDGVPQRELRTRVGTVEALQRAGLLPEEDIPAVGEHELASELAERSWLAMRRLSRDRAVLACTLAHLIAMRIAVEEGYDVVCEDNICGPVRPEEAARRIRACAAASPGAALRYYAYGGKVEEVRSWLQAAPAATESDAEAEVGAASAALPWPREKRCDTAGGAQSGGYRSLLWGCMATRSARLRTIR